MEVEFKERDGCVIFYLDGPVELYQVETIYNSIVESIKKNGFNNVILNFEKVSFLDSSGIGFLIKLKDFLKDKKLRFCNMKENLIKVFEFAHLLKFFKIDSSEEKSILNIKSS